MNYDSPSFWGTSDNDEAENIAEFVRAASLSKHGTSDSHNLHPDCRFMARRLWEQDAPAERAGRVLVWTKIKP